jgi:two-component system, chemotaxis family, protein-glutamate methylesterase/glutaminase
MSARRTTSPGYRMVAIGGSWGGAAAVRAVLAAVPRGFPAAVAVVLHRSHDSSGDALTRLIGGDCPLAVSEVEDKEDVEPGRVYLGPADYHLIVEGDHFALSTDVAVRYSRPSIDVLFDSVADAYGPAAVGVVLTGANDDGAQGLVNIHEAGGYTVAQNPDTAERPEMPRAAVETGVVDRVAELDEIGGLLVDLCLREPS